MVAMVKKLGWTYVSIVYEESSYGEKGYDEVQQRLRNDNICIAVTEKLPKDSGVAVATAYDKVVANLNLLPANGRGVIVFASDQEVSEMMRAVRRANLTGNFMWIGSDGWGGRRLVSDTNEAEVEGAITFQPYAEPFTEFENYFLSLTPDNNPRNPWFVEYWEDYFKCRVAGSPTTPFNGHYKPCTRHERQNRTNGYVPEAQLQFVSNAVMAFAFALKNLHRDFCGSDYKGICDNWVETNRSGDLLLQYLLNVTFEGLVGGSFKFLPNGDAPAKYRVLNFKRVSAKEYNWVAVGTYNEGNLAINEAELQFKWNMRKHNMSYCNKKCDMNQATSYLKGNKCCWNCITCSTYEYLTENRDQCRECSPGTKPNENRTICVDIPVEYLTFNSGLSIVAITVASCGLIVTSFIIAVFVRYCSTPVVRAAGRELTFVLLVGILGCYSMTFIILSPPNVITCGAQRFGIGFWFSICYAALLTKTNRIARIFRAGRRTIKRPNFISPTSQLLICGAFVTFQVFIGVAWMLWQPPRAISYYPTREENILICDSGLGSGSMIGLFYPIILIGVCTVYAVQTRKIPEAFNESKYIGFTMYTTSIIWLAFVAIFFGTANNVKIRLATLCFTISLSASVVLACLFTPKLYIILIRPDRNVRQSMMAGKLAATAAKVKANSSTSSPRLDSGNLSDGEMELHQRLKRSPSVSSSISRNTIGTQTQQQGGSNISTQTLDVPSHRIVYDYLMDVQL